MAKITALFILVAFMQVSAKSYSQVGKIKLSVNNATLVEVFQQIENESDYRFFYDNEQVDLTKKVTVSTENKELSELLNELFLDTDLTYEMMDNLILVKSKNKAGDDLISAKSEQGDIKGKVTDINGEPMPGVTVVVKGTTNGTITDIDGSYIISNAPEDGILEFSFVGMRAQEVEIAGQSSINVTLVEDMIGIEEVVAIGYGTQKKETVTGAITQVNTEDVNLSPAPKLTDGLAGRVSGVIINQRGGEPGRTETEIFIRGRSTTEDSSPLYVIDGIARDYNGLDRLDPNDIESLTVLKDASAAIYGARAANGVILITTKRGRIGKPTIKASYNHGFSQPTRRENLASSAQFAEAWNLINAVNGLEPQYSDEEIQKFADGSDPVNYPNTRWYDVIYKDWKHQDRANLSVSGGSEKVKYFVGAGYLQQKSPFNDGFGYNKQYNIRSNLDATITPDLTVSIDLSGRLDDILSGDIDYPHIYLGYPYVNAFWPGTDYYTDARTGDNVALMTREKDYGYTSTDRGVFTSSLSATYNIPGVDGLSLAGTFAYDYNKNYEKDYTGVTYIYDYDQSSGEYIPKMNSNSSTPTLDVAFLQGKSQTANLRLAYVKTFNDVHNIDAFVAYEQNKTHIDNLSAGRSQFLSGAIHELFAGTADKNYQTNDGSAFETARQNYFGRIQYDYANKYLFQFSLRRDGSQNFASDKRWGWFPGVSAGWTLTEESFMKGLSSLDFLKIRASWGQLGNDNVDAFQYLTAYSYGDNYIFGGTTAQGLVQSGVPNPNITWEVAETTDLGVEARMWGGKLGMDVDLFKTRRSNILATRNASVPYYTGLELPDENIGIVENKGLELTLTNRGQIGNEIEYSLAGNFTYIHNEVIDIDEAPLSEDYQLQTGKPIGAPLLYEVIGIFKDEADLASYPSYSGYGPGDFKILDANDDGVINSNDMIRQDLSSSPEIVFGFTSNFQYKQFELNLSFQGQARVLVTALPVFPFNPPAFGNFNAWLVEDGWTLENTDATKPKPGIGFGVPYSNTTFLQRNGAFVRLKNAELAYNIPKSLLSRTGISNCRVYVSGYNLFSIDGLKDLGVDPEVNSGFGVPVMPDRIINLGVSLTL
ncbi:TonB-dependent receptor [Draconibacterium sp. IB214405]|uniref:TonB-dependent receptor n=1 Tax=Draconibacterium sp. IB214405 TaxID=3097352 RepID=UPI002A11F37D|nr:TonB-dependent receptor [Draconibacterium sp. IB214405]MDX8339345.1 TonB-dependent receptor [Draconibacterium sp. IB214405]